MRRHVHLSGVVAFAGFFAVVMLAGLGLKDYVTRASIQDVRAVVQRGPTGGPEEARRLIVAGQHLPDLTRWSWKLTGARSDTLEDARDAITGFYARGGRTLAVTIVDGDQGLTDDDAEWGAGTKQRPVLSVRRELAGRTVVLTGWPADAETERALQELGRGGV